jgi:hypothetical protein
VVDRTLWRWACGSSGLGQRRWVLVRSRREA